MDPKTNFFTKPRSSFAVFSAAAVFCILSIFVYDSVFSGIWEYDSGEVPYSQNSCNVAGVLVRGDIYTYAFDSSDEDSGAVSYPVTSSEDVVYLLKSAEDRPNIKAIYLEIDSPGGEPVAGEEISYAIENSTKPVVAVIRQQGTSAAYWAASGADRIFASRNSDIGSIGVTMSYLENNLKDQKFIELSSGKFKDYGNPDKPITAEEKNLLLRDVAIIHENFIEAVANNRKLPLESVRKIADGSSMLGMAAKELGLIDAIGSAPQAEAWLKDQIGEDVEVCW